MSEGAYQQAYMREKQAREYMESLLEDKSRELYLSNEALSSKNTTLEKQALELRLLLSATDFFRQGDTFLSALEHLTSELLKLMNGHIGLIYLPQEEGACFSISGHVYSDGMDSLIKDELLLGNIIDATELSSSIVHRSLVKNSMIMQDQQWCIFTEQLQVTHELSIPIQCYEDMLASITLYLNEDALSEDNLRLINVAIDHVRNLLKRRHSEAMLKENYDELEKVLVQLQERETQLAQSEKMASIGLLAAGIAHEVNNPVGYVASNVVTLDEYIDVFRNALARYELLYQAVEGKMDEKDIQNRMKDICTLNEEDELDYVSSDLTDVLDDIKEGVGRIKEIVQNLKTFAHSDGGKVGLDDVNQGLESTLKLLKNEINSNCRLKIQYGNLPQIECNLRQLNQVFMNLIINAMQAMEATKRQDRVLLITTCLCNEYIEVRISDTGAGISKENQRKLFDPFFTTKPVGEGTGLGLSIVYNIVVKDHGGKLSVESELGQGTTFILRLPLTQRSSEEGRGGAL